MKLPRMPGKSEEDGFCVRIPAVCNRLEVLLEFVRGCDELRAENCALGIVR